MAEQKPASAGTVSDTSDHLFHLANRIISLMFLVILALVLIVVGLLIFYGVLITDPHESANGAAVLKDLIMNVWGQLIPYVTRFVTLVAPAFVLIFALGFLHRLGANGASPFAVTKLLSDLPSALALLIIATICLLPLAGLVVPDVLNNIALVVVGFYFGKRKGSEDA